MTGPDPRDILPSATGWAILRKRKGTGYNVEVFGPEPLPQNGCTFVRVEHAWRHLLKLSVEGGLPIVIALPAGEL